MAGVDIDVVARAAAKGGRTLANARYRWTKAMKGAFLDHLAASCNIRASARAIGVSSTAAHRLRRRDAAFASDWSMALEAGYQLLETHLIGIALATSGAVVVGQDDVGSGYGADEGEGLSGGGENEPDAAAVATVVIGLPKSDDFDTAFRMLRHRTGTRAGARHGSPPLGISTRQDTDAEILKKLAALAARRSST